jgi:membrane-bound lytic murein transglycosylase D
MRRRLTEGLAITAALVALAGCATTGVTPADPAVPAEQVAGPPGIEIAEPLAEAHEELTLLVESTLESIQRREVLASEINRSDADAAASLDMPDHASVRSAIALFSTRLQPKIQASLDRSLDYKPMIDTIFDEYRLPRALTWLPVIESGFISSSVSRAGALGIWQFMPATAREYGLRVDWWVDERLDPLASTRAAATYLKDLHAIFGDWPLALASYNAGPGRVRRTMAAVRADSFWDMQRNAKLPRETRGYVPTFYATIAIVSDPVTYGFRLCEPRSRGDYDVERIELAGPVTLDFVAEVAHVTAETMYALNPAFRQGIVPPGPAAVSVPGDGAELVRDMAPYLSDADPYLPVARYTVRRGDTIRTVAQKLGVSHFAVSAMNGNARTLRAGEEIYVPVRRSDLSARLMQASFETVHVVRKGDTLSKIAQKYGLTARELAAMNDLSLKSTIHPGDRLTISTTAASVAGM